MYNNLKNEIDKEFNKEKNYQSIISNVKEVENMKVISKNKVLNVAALFIIVIIFGVISNQVYAKIKWNIEFKEYQNRDYVTGFGTIKDDDFSEEVEMDYTYQNGIKVKIDSLLLTDDTFKTNVNFQFDENLEVPSKEFDFSYAIYDENNNIYGIGGRIHKGEKKDKITPYIYEELGVKYDKHDIYSPDNRLHDVGGVGNIEAHDRTIISEIKLETAREFPKSKKIFIRIFDLGYTMYDFSNDNEGNRPKLNAAESFTISNSEWIFEIEVPEKFYNRETTYLTLKEDISGVKISKLTITESGLVIVGEFEGLNEIVNLGDEMLPRDWTQRQYDLLYITDGEANRYDSLNASIDGMKNLMSAKFGPTKSIFEDSGLYLNYTDITGNLHTVEIINKN